MRIIYSQKDGESFLSREKFRRIVAPVLATSRNSKLLTKIFFYKQKYFVCKKCRGTNFKEDLAREYFIVKEVISPVETKYEYYPNKDVIPKEMLDKAVFVPKGTCGKCGSKDFEERWGGHLFRGNFRSVSDHGFYDSEEKFYKEGIRGFITLKFRPDISEHDIFLVFAHEFYHWRQSNVVNYNGPRYSERKAEKWAQKMIKRHLIS